MALREWQGPSRAALDEVELVHSRVEGGGVGRRMLTQQVNYAYAALILAHFQRYCRAVHTEAAEKLIATIPDASLARVVVGLLVEGRFLDRANPTPGNLHRDFARFGFKLWDDLEAHDRRTRRRKEKLEQLCEWRNGITHGDIPRKRAAGRLVPLDLSLEACRAWRRSLGALAGSIDRVVASECQGLGVDRPW